MLFRSVSQSRYPLAPNNLTDAGWSGGGITKTANLPGGPTGATSSNKMTETATNAQHFLSYSIISGTIDTHNVSAYLKKGTGSVAPDRIAISVGNATYGMWAIFNLTTGLIETQVPGTATSFQVAMTNAGNGWWRCSVGGDLNYTTNQVIRTAVQFCNNSASYNPFTTSYMGNVNADVLVANLQWIKEAGLQRYGTSGNGTGYVTTWYDQSGSARNSTQITAAAQPYIVSNGSLILRSGKPAIYFDGVDDTLRLSTVLPLSDITTLFAVAFANYENSSNDIVLGRRGAASYRFGGGNNLINALCITRAESADYIYGSTPATAAGLNTLAVFHNHYAFGNYDGLNRTRIYSNGVWRNDGNSFGQSGFNNIEYIGSGGDCQFFKNTIQELIFYPSNQISNRIAIENNINSYYSLWNRPAVVSDGLVLNLDAADINSYLTTGTEWFNIAATNSTIKGALVNGPAFSTANGGVINFDGINDYVSFSSQILNSSSFTIDMFVNSNNFNISGSRWRRLLVIDGNGLGENPFSFFIDGSGRLGYILGSGSANLDTQVPLPNSPTLSTNTWYNIVISFDGSVKRVYVNGVLYSTVNSSSTFTNASNKNMIIGYFGDLKIYLF